MPDVAARITIGGDLSALDKDIAQRVNKQYQLKLAIDSRNFPLGQISRDTNDFEKSLKAAEARVLAFGATAGILTGTISVLKLLVNSAVQVEKSLTDINTVLNLSNSNLSRFGSDLFDVAKQTGQSFKEVAEVAKEFSRQGLGVEATLTRTKDALILARLSGLGLDESLKSITSSLNSFDKAFLTSTDTVNKLIAVDRSFAVSSADLAESISRVGSTAQDAGVSFNELLGIVTAVQQTTARGGAVIGNALKSIFTRLGRNDTIQQLQELGVQINNNQTGLEKLKALSDGIKLNPAFANQIKELAGGVYQINTVSAALQDLGKQYSIVSQATEIAANATNEAITANSSLNKTIANISNEALQNLTELSAKLGQDLFGPAARGLLSEFNDISSKIKEASQNDTGITSVGLKFGEGIIKGIGEYISGPGLALVGLLLGKVALNFGSFAKNSLEGLLNISSVAKQQELASRAVNDILSSRKSILESVYNGTKTIQQAEIEVLGILKQQSLEKERQVSLAKTIGTSIVSSPIVQVNNSISRSAPEGFKYKASGFVPVSSSVSPMDSVVETSLAKAAGYNPGEVRQMRIPNYGQVVFNSREKVVDFGMGQPAILPPEGTLAANKYQKEFEDTHGFNPYAAFGMIPNFVKTLGRGAFGTFQDLEKTFGGLPIGKKIFNTVNAVPNSGIAQEFDISKTLKELSDNGKINPLFNFPAVFGSLERSIKAQRIGKEVINGKTLSKTGISYELTGPFRDSLENELSPFGIQADDLHSGNFIVNQKFIDIFKKIEKSGNGQNKYDFIAQITRGKNRKRNISRISSAIARQGGKLSLIDSGEFTKSGTNYLKYNGNNDFSKDLIDNNSVDANLDVLKAFLQERGLAFANGLVPNYAKISGKGISSLDIAGRLRDRYEKGKFFSSFYKDYRKGLAETGMPDSDIALFNRIYASISYGADDKNVLSSAKNIFLKHKSTGSFTPEDYLNELRPIGNINNRLPALNKALNNLPLGQKEDSKTRIYLDALSGNDEAIAIDRNFIAASINRKLDEDEKISGSFRNRIDKTARELSTSLGISGSELQAAVFAGERSSLKGKRGITSFQPFADAFASLREAVIREQQAGVPSNLIRVGQSESLVNEKNTLGLGVFNRIDEPNGLQQGINRVISKGKSPKNRAEGLVPNYALPTEAISFTKSPGVGLDKRIAKQEEVIALIEQFKQEVKNSFGQQQQITNFARQLGVDYKLTDETIKKIQSSLKASVQYYDKQKEAAKEIANRKFPEKSNTYTGADEFIANPNFLNRLVNKEDITLSTNFLSRIKSNPNKPATKQPSETQTGFSALNDPFLFGSLEQTIFYKNKDRLDAALEEKKKKSDALSAYAASARVFSAGRSAVPQDLERGVSAAIALGETTQGAKYSPRNFGASSNIDAIEQAFAAQREADAQAIIKKALTRLSGTYSTDRPEIGSDINPIINQNALKPLPQQNRFSFGTKQDNNLILPIEKQTGFVRTDYGSVGGPTVYSGKGNADYGNFSVFSGGNNIAKQIKNEIESSSQPKSQLLNKITSKANSAFGDSRGYFIGLAAEGASGAIQSVIGDETLSRRRAGSVVGAVGGTISSAATGGLIGSSIAPGVGTAVGAGIGALIGSISGLVTAITNWGNILPDIEKKLVLVKESTSKTTDAITRYIDTTQKLADVYSGNSTVSAGQLKRLQEDQRSALLQANLSDDEIKSVSASGIDTGKVTDIFSNVISRNIANQRSLERDTFINTKLNKFVKNTGFIADITGTSLKEQELTSEGKLATANFAENLLSVRNNKGNTLSSILQNDNSLIKGLGNAEGSGKLFFERLDEIFSKNDFGKDVSDQMKQLIAKLDNSDNGIPKEIFSIIERIPENKRLVDELAKIQKEKVVQSRTIDTSFFDSFASLNKEINYRISNAAQDTFNVKQSNLISGNDRELALNLSGLTSNDFKLNFDKLNNSLQDLDEKFIEVGSEISTSFITNINKAGLSIAESFGNSRFRAVQEDNNITPELRSRRLNATSKIIDEINKVSNDSTNPNIAIENAQNQRNIIERELNPKISDVGTQGLDRKFLEIEIEARKKLAEELEKYAAETAISTEQLKASTTNQNYILRAQAESYNTILRFNKTAAIGGPLSSFGPSVDISKALFDLTNEVKINKESRNIEGQTRALTGIAKIYTDKGLKIPSDVKQNILETTADSLRTQVEQRKLILPKGETPESIAYKKFTNEFKQNDTSQRGVLDKTPFVIKDVTGDIESQVELFGNVKEQLNLISGIKSRIIVLNDKILKQEVDGLEAQRNLNLEIRKQLSAQGEDAFNKGRITGDQFRQIQLQRRAAEKDVNGGRLSGGSLRDSFFDQFRYNTRDMYDDLEKGAAEVGQQLKNGFKDAFKSFADGTKSAEDALADFGISILKKLGDTAFDVAINSVFNVIGNSVGSSFGYKGGRAKGGLITEPKKFSTGGTVSGGSGVKDDVPALLSQGEYVIKKSSANRYGIDFLDSINSGSVIYDGTKNAVKTDDTSSAINAVFKNAYSYDNPTRPTKGNLELDPVLSNFALEDDNNPLNQLRQSREEGLGSYLRDKKDYEEYKKSQLEAFRTQQRRALQAAWIQAGISAAALGIQYGASAYGAKAAGATTAITGATGNTVVSQRYNTGVGYSKYNTTGGVSVLDTNQYNSFSNNPQAFGYSSATNLRYINYGGSTYSGSSASFGSYGNYGVGYRRAMGGIIPKYAKGGSVHTFGGDTSTDRIPALLMGGEYVMRQNAVKVYGKEFFDKLNSGSIRKMASGGYVGDSISAGATDVQSNDVLKLIAELNKTIDSLRASIDKKIESSTDSSSSGTVNNISINVNVDKSGDVTKSTDVSQQTDSKVSDRDKQRKDAEEARKTSEQIESAVIQILAKQKRPGGILAS